MKRFAPLAFLSILVVACQQPVIKSAPSISFASFVNTNSGVSIPGSSTTLPTNFVAQIRSGDEDKVVDVQCALNGTNITAGAAYRANCAYAVVGTNATLSATASNPSNLSNTATKSVTIDNVAPTATSLQVGSSNFDPTTGTSFNTTLTLNTTSLLKIVSSDPDVLQTFIELDGNRLAESAGNTAQYSLSVTNSSPFGLKFGVVDKAGNISRYSVLVAVNQILGDGTPPTVSIASPVSAVTVSGNLIITVNASDSSGIKKVTLIANNNPVANTVPQNGEPSVSFALDTLKFENGPLELKAIAVDTSDLSTTSNAVNVTVNNIQGPVLSIASPSNNSKVSGQTTVAVNILKRASGFNYATPAECTAASLASDCGSIKVDLIDYRGTIVGSKFITTANPGSTKLFESGSFDLSAIPNDFYTFRSSVNVIVAGETTPTKLFDEVVIQNTNTSQQPPAIIITNPIRVNELQTILPVFGQPFGFVVVELSDNSGLDSVELRATCDSCASGSGPVNALEQYVNLNAASVAKVALRLDADGTPYLPNGDYTLRVVAQDTGSNRNIQEVKVKINRDPNYVKLTYSIEPGLPSKKFDPGSGKCIVKGLDAAKRYRVASWFIDPAGKYSFRDESVTNATEAGISSAFNQEGNWLCFSQVVNVTDARTDWVQGGFTVVAL
jgi:large repetitive protein